jgi:hypothetical protein
MTHAWCHDTARDAAVRAAEDGRDRPLPTLGEAIGAPFACTACGGFGMDHRCRESCGECDGLGRVYRGPVVFWCKRCDGTGLCMIPKSVSASSPVEQENKGDGMAANGLRTERVVIEVTGAPGWKVNVTGVDVESVRVVDEPLSDAWAQRLNRLTAERDAAIREREELKARLSRVLKSSDSMWSQILVVGAERDKLRARVAELEAASGGGEGEGTFFGAGGPFNFQYAEDSFFPPNVHGFLRQCVKIKDAPPQPRGWLTEEERALVQSWERHYTQGAHYAQSPSHTNDIAAEMGKLAEVCRSLLARSSPPEVVLPENPYHPSGLREGFEHAIRIVRNELVNAGVAVREVTHD